MGDWPALTCTANNYRTFIITPRGMEEKLSYTIFPLGDNALTVDFGNTISEILNQRVVELFRNLGQNPFRGMLEAVPAYSSLTIYYNPLEFAKDLLEGHSVYDRMRIALEERMRVEINPANAPSRRVRIPVCYEAPFARDLAEQSLKLGVAEEEIIRLHHSTTYKVYMLGFLPGFTYMGEVDEKITMPRKATPQQVEAGSVGIAGRQTGIYPIVSPGGWNIIGRTPLLLFNASAAEPVLLQSGDMIQFYPITKNEFENYQSGDT